MARKKSAAKRAKELEAQKEILEKHADPQVQKEVENEFEEVSEPSSDSSEDEDEDDYGELITDNVEEGINKVLDALKKNDKSLLDPSVRFFDDSVEVNDKLKSEKEKPVYLKDYHRMNLLSGTTFDEDDDKHINYDNDEGIKTYNQEQEEERQNLLSEINDAFQQEKEDEDDDDGFLKKKQPAETSSAAAVPTRTLPDPDKDEEQFLREFANQQAWIPHKGDTIIDLDKRGDDNDEFDDAVEQFEKVYNFRYEDSNSAEIVSYARNQATMRRNETNSRRSKREAKKLEKQKAQELKQAEVNKIKNEKINKLTDILTQVKKEYGADINEDLVKKLSDTLLDKDFDDSQWDTVLAELFNDEFYQDENVKPEWDEDDEIMKEFHDEAEEEPEEPEEKEEKEEQEEKEEEKPKTKKEQLKEKKSAKNEKKLIKDLASKAIEDNKLKIIDQVEEEREGRSKEKKHTFKYREVSPESFGLTTREIFLADDKDLNELIGIKKFAPYRPKELRMKDKRKYTKSKNLKEWRKKVFKHVKNYQDEDEDIIKIPVDNGSNKRSSDFDSKKAKKRRSSK